MRYLVSLSCLIRELPDAISSQLPKPQSAFAPSGQEVASPRETASSPVGVTASSSLWWFFFLRQNLHLGETASNPRESSWEKRLVTVVTRVQYHCFTKGATADNLMMLLHFSLVLLLHSVLGKMRLHHGSDTETEFHPIATENLGREKEEEVERILFHSCVSEEQDYISAR